MQLPLIETSKMEAEIKTKSGETIKGNLILPPSNDEQGETTVGHTIIYVTIESEGEIIEIHSRDIDSFWIYP